MSKDVNEKLREAAGCFNAGDLAGAERACRSVLAQAPDHPGALHLLGVAQLAGDRPREAAACIGRAAQIASHDPIIQENLGLALLMAGDPRRAEAPLRRAIELGASHASVHMRLGMALGALGRVADAEAALRRAAALEPGNPDVQINLGNALAGQGRDAEAAACYERLLEFIPDHLDALFNLGAILMRQGRLDEAAARYERVLALNPDNADTHNNLGLVRERQERLGEAMAHYQRALALNPRHVAALVNLGNLLHGEGRLEEAVVHLERALRIDEHNVDARINLGNVRADEGRFDEARGCFEHALRLDAASYEAQRNLGGLLEREGRWPEALEHYRRAQSIAPERAEAYLGLGSVWREAGRFEDAATAYEQAVARAPRRATAWFSLGEMRKLQGRLDAAIKCFERALAAKPAYPQALASLIHARQNACAWDGIEALWAKLREGAHHAGPDAASPFAALSMPTSALEQMRLAQAWAHNQLAPYAAARPRLNFDFSGRARGERLRVGYLSWDFHRHATSYLIAELFELHDRSRFEVIAYSYGPDDGSAIRARIRGACDRFVDIAGDSHFAAARKIYGDGVDILVDLKGHTVGARTPIMAQRPALVQVNWLGYPGTMGTDCIDYIIADPFVIPEGSERHYSERVVRLPGCYQINDRRREIAERTPAREECGLPSSAFVFCCFNQAYKILPETFALWMRLLGAVDGSVLWLLETTAFAAANLRQAAAAAGVAPERLVFAPRKPMSEHLARYRVADLALDTFPYTSHTTASDALWAGCPLVTCAGETFASRVAGSILISADLRDLVTGSFEECERLAVALASEPDRLAELRRRLTANRDTCALFDTPRFVSNLEGAYEQMFDAFTCNS